MPKLSELTPVDQFRIVALLEGVSLLILFGIAMPMKYFAGMPLAVQIVGLIHGILFLMFCAFIALFIVKFKMPVKIGCAGLIASILPFGTFFFDPHIKKGQSSS